MQLEKTVHVVANGKGGIGKTFCAWNLTEYLISKDRNVFAADTDPVNATLTSYKALNAKHFQISERDMSVNPMKFDALIQEICMHGGDTVIDNGSGSFLPVMNYIKRNGVIDFLAEYGCRTIIHTPIIAGQSLSDTVRGLESILDFTDASVVVWENEIEGPIIRDGIRFSESALHKEYSGRILGTVTLPKFVAEVGETLKMFTSTSRTYNEALEDERVMLIQKDRIKKIRSRIFDQLDKVAF